jgi:phosphatidate cytidylyltransferase
VAPSGKRPLGTAVVTALVLVALVGIFYLLGPKGFFWLAAAVVSLAVYELFASLKKAGRRPSAVIGVACGFAMMAVSFYLRPAYVLVVLAAALFGAFLFALRPGRGEGAVTDVAWTLLGVAWIGGGGAGAVSILDLNENGHELLIAVVFIIALGDIAAYFTGTSLGRHKLAPRISPGKSWEGAIGGGLSSIVAGTLFGWLLVDLTVPEGLLLGAICGIVAPVGDLFESLAKREIGVKDSGSILPGHGGFLDRLDAIVLCAPLAYLYLRFVLS